MSAVQLIDTPIPNDDKGLSVDVQMTEQHWQAARFRRLEHVTVTLHIEHSKRGDVEVSLVSPHGFLSVLGTRRPFDDSPKGFQNWTFLTVKHW
jgi:kexin